MATIEVIKESIALTWHNDGEGGRQAMATFAVRESGGLLTRTLNAVRTIPTATYRSTTGAQHEDGMKNAIEDKIDRVFPEGAPHTITFV